MQGKGEVAALCRSTEGVGPVSNSVVVTEGAIIVGVCCLCGNEKGRFIRKLGDLHQGSLESHPFSHGFVLNLLLLFLLEVVQLLLKKSWGGKNCSIVCGLF